MFLNAHISAMPAIAPKKVNGACSFNSFSIIFSIGLCLMDSNEILYATVIRSFYIIREVACWELVTILMVGYTFTAYTFARTGFISTIAYLFIFIYLALHIKTSNLLYRPLQSAHNSLGNVCNMVSYLFKITYHI